MYAASCRSTAEHSPSARARLMAGHCRLPGHHELPAGWLFLPRQSAGPNHWGSEMTDSTETCPHGPRLLNEGIGRNGRPYRGLFCPRRTCPPEWQAPWKVETPEAVAYSAAIKAAKATCTEVTAEARRVRDQAIAEAKAVYELATGKNVGKTVSTQGDRPPY
jgi:hypothetical protein